MIPVDVRRLALPTLLFLALVGCSDGARTEGKLANQSTGDLRPCRPPLPAQEEPVAESSNAAPDGKAEIIVTGTIRCDEPQWAQHYPDPSAMTNYEKPGPKPLAP